MSRGDEDDHLIKVVEAFGDNGFTINVDAPGGVVEKTQSEACGCGRIDAQGLILGGPHIN